MPHRLRDKYIGQNKKLNWQYLFPSSKLSLDPETKQFRRHHVDEKQVQRAVKKAAQLAGITKAVTPHTLRHSFATHLLQSSTDIRTVREQLWHADVKTTEIYTHVLKWGAKEVTSPLSALIYKKSNPKATAVPQFWGLNKKPGFKMVKCSCETH